MKIIYVSTICIFFSILSYGQETLHPIQNSINSFASSSGLENAIVSFQAYDLTEDKILATLNEAMAIPPASTTKLFTTSGAFEILGKEYTPKTKIYRYGEIDSAGILHGDIVIRGFGDSSLGSRFFTKKDEKNQFLTEWIEKIENVGIKAIEGRILVDGSTFGYNGNPDGWNWSDMGNYYGSGPSGAVVYDNMTYLHFSTSTVVNGPTSIDSTTPPIPGLKIDNKVKSYAYRSDNAYVYGSPYSFERFVVGHLPKGEKNFEVRASIPDPELVLAQTVSNALEKKGILISLQPLGVRLLQLEKDTVINYNQLTLLFEYKGKSVGDISYWVNQQSVNLFAEQLLCLIGYEKTGYGSTNKSVDYLNSFWENKLQLKMFQTDGSGLSRNNAFSANHFIALLKYMYKSKNFEAWEFTLPIAGKSGTLMRMGRDQPAQGKVKAKSGSMLRIRSYVGYVDANNGHKIAFAFTVNNYTVSNANLVKMMEKVFNVMVSN